MIFTDAEIEAAVVQEPQAPLITPFDRAQLQPASYDCTLGYEFLVCNLQTTGVVDPEDPSSYENLMRREVLYEDEPGACIVIHPGEFILGTTHEFFDIPADVSARIEGKSSLGRLGLLTHVTAGFIDPGFKGTITLEFGNLLRVPIRLTPGMRICQVSFSHMAHRAREPYQGRYQGNRGAMASRYGDTHA